MQRRSSVPRQHPVAFLSFAILLTACGGGGKQDSFVSRDGRIHDAEGRELLLHGVNARVEGIFDVTFDDGRIPLEHIPEFTEEDCRFLGEDLGLNHLRLPVNWSAIEPHDDDFREDYIDDVLAIAAMCERHGVLTLVDFHQDAWSKEIGEDGAPLWAIIPPPTMLLQGPLTDLGARRGSAQVLEAFEAFFNDVDGIQSEYAEMARWVARRIDGRPGVIGLELMNEPITIVNSDNIEAFNNYLAAEIRRAAPNLTVFFEPNSLRNIGDIAPVGSYPFEHADGVYAPHIYVDIFEDGWTPDETPKLEMSVAAARTEATQHGDSALYVGEFGSGPTPEGQLYSRTAMRVFDDNLASWAYWVYEEASQGSWGLYDAIPGEPPSRGALRESEADLLARAYPVAVAGHLDTVAYDVATRVLTVGLKEAHDDLDHVFSVPHRTYPAGVAITCGGSPVTAAVVAGRARFRCAASTIVLSPL